jgi:Bacteriophage head to tail connecting protein
MMKQDAVAGIVRRAKQRKEDSRQWFILYEELAHYFHFRRKGFLAEITQGQELNDDIWNNYPETARRRLTEAFVSSACPKDRMWIGLMPANQALAMLPHVRAWCELVSHIMYTIIYDPQVNFTERMNEQADDASTFGMSVIYIDHDRRKRHITMSVHHLKNFAFEFDVNGELTRQYCFWNMSIDDIVEMFGIEALPKEMQEKYHEYEGKNDKCEEVIHAIIPNTDYLRAGFTAPGRLPLQSLWILGKGEGHVLGSGGYYEFPYVVPRWYRRSDEGRGRGVAENALPDARLLQAVAAALLEITEKQGNPPMQGPVDILRGEIELFPGGFTPFDASGFQFQGDPLRPVQLGNNPALTAQYLDRLEAKIADAFFADAFSMPQRDANGKTSEVSDPVAQGMVAAAKLGPVFSRVENEMLPVILDRIFSISARARAFPPPPQEFADGEQLIWVFDNHIADMRQINEAQRILQGISATAQLAQIPQAGQALENLDWDAAFRDIWYKMRVPQSYMKDPQVVAALRQQEQQQQQAAQIAELLKAGGPGMKQAVEGATQARDQGLLPSPAAA